MPAKGSTAAGKAPTPGKATARTVKPLKAALALELQRRHPPVECDPFTCPCDDGTCALSRYTRAFGGGKGETLALERSENAMAERFRELAVDLPAMAAVGNLYRAVGTVRNHIERSVLTPNDLTWTGWEVLWVVWIWGEIEARHVATESGISKATLTGVVDTLETRGLLARRQDNADRRRVLVRMTPAGTRLMTKLFPAINAVESELAAGLEPDEVLKLAHLLRKLSIRVEEVDGIGAQVSPTKERPIGRRPKT